MNAKDNTVSTMAAETIAGDLLGALVSEIKLLPDIWVKIARDEQAEVIDRLRKRVLDNVREAVRLIAAADRSSVKCELRKLTVGDRLQGIVDFSKRDASALNLAYSIGSACLIVTVDADQFMGGADDVKPDDNQLGLPGVDGDGGTAGKVIEQARRRSKRKPDAPDPFQ